MENFEVIIESREVQSKGASRRLRRAGKVPGILYGGEKDPVPFSVSHNEMLKHLAHEAFYSHILTLKMGEQTEKAVLKDLQRHPAKPFLLHIDFQRVDESQQLHMHVPLHFINEEHCVGVKQDGGVIAHLMSEVEIHCLPKALPEFIEVDLSEIHAGDSVHLSALKLPEGVEIPALAQGADHDLPVVAVHKGRGGAGSDDEESEGEVAE